MGRHQRSQAELQAALQEQREFLRSSCAAYDAGNYNEAKRIATAIYILVFDSSRGNSKSVLGQLKLKNSLRFVSTTTAVDNSIIPNTRLSQLLSIHNTVAPHFVPHCYREGLYPFAKERPLRFSEWWEESVIEHVKVFGPTEKTTEKHTLSRKNLLFRLRSADGGAHFDPDLREEFYTQVSAGDGIGVHATFPDGAKFILRPHLATMRQIGWEIEQTLLHIPGGPAIKPPPSFDELQRRLRDQSLVAMGKSATTPEEVGGSGATLHAEWPSFHGQKKTQSEFPEL